MTKKLILPAVLLLGISGAALAADIAYINGKWTAEVEGRNGTVTETLVLNASGNNLTGSFTGARGGAVDISDGTIDGNKVSFKVVREFNGNQVAQQYKGTLSDSGELDLTVSMGGGGRRGGGGGKGGRGGGGRNLVFKKAAN
jgi:hypothetical protein